jgi:hypothetical protein
MMNQIRVYHIDAFTQNPFEGNPAGVVPYASNLTLTQMQKITNELNLPESAFYCHLPIRKQIFVSVISHHCKKSIFAAMQLLALLGCLQVSTYGMKKMTISSSKPMWV